MYIIYIYIYTLVHISLDTYIEFVGFSLNHLYSRRLTSKVLRSSYTYIYIYPNLALSLLQKDAGNVVFFDLLGKSSIGVFEKKKSLAMDENTKDYGTMVF